MTALALARHYTLDRKAPVLFISNEDPFERAVALIRPLDAASYPHQREQLDKALHV
jgi:hypothetical protein